MSALDLEGRLNEAQLAAVTHGEGPQLVLAGAGSGKTRVITHRIGWLIEEMGVDPRAITAMTFTNKAAREMESRVETLLRTDRLESSVGTFHRFGLKLLRRFGERIELKRGFTVFDDTDQIALVKRSLKDEGLDEGSFPPRTMLSRISDAKSRLLTPAAHAAGAETFFEKRLAQVFRRYEHLLQRSSAVDFDDLIGLPVRLLVEDAEIGRRIRGGLRHLLVDEFQDTNHAQLRLVRELIGPGGNITAVGDEDQGIYRWRGADLANVLEFEKSFPDAVVRKLEQNYRSTQTILDASGGLIAHNEGRRGKRLWTDRGAGDPLELFRARDEIDEARWVVRTARQLEAEGARWSEIGVLVRTNAQTRALEEELLRTETPYALVGGTRFYQRAEIRDLVAYLRAIGDPRDQISMERILNQPPRGIGRKTQRLVATECERQGLTLWDFLVVDQFESLPERSAKALRRFRDLLQALQGDLDQLPLVAFLDQLLERTGYLGLFAGDDEDSRGRRENVGEFLSAAQGFGGESESGRVSLTELLDHIALVSDLDGWKVERGVSLMTLHSAKGLEFPLVFIGGLEEGVIPHYNAKEPADIEEERRLLYVGMTRAERRLFLSSCLRRRVAGRFQDQRPSPFLDEIPSSLVIVHDSPSLFEGERTRGAATFFGRQQAASEPEPGKLAKGSRVRHPKLGDGVVLSVEGYGDGAKLTVFFASAGKRKLVAKFANLESVS